MMGAWGYGLGMGGGGILFWALLIGIGIYFFTRSNSRVYMGDNRNSNALDLLKERYARGEIGSEEYKRRRQDLEDRR